MEYGKLKQRKLFKIEENWLKEYLYNIFSFHLENAPYWRKNHKRDHKVFSGSLKEVVENVLNTYSTDENLLREEWLDFLPRNYKGCIRFYQSSGTTGKRKFAHWDKEYVGLLVKYLKNTLDILYNPTIKHAIVHGPYGWYQEEMSELIWSYGGKLYFVGIETEGIKCELEEKGPQVIMEKFKPLMNYTQRVLEKDELINTVRTSPQLLDFLQPHREKIENIMISGTEINSNLVENIAKMYPKSKIIPFYGHFLFGDAVGIYRNGELMYYPFYPFAIILPVKEENKYKIVGYDEVGKMGIIVARPEILFVTVENEYIKRVRPVYPFKYDGFANPKREMG